MRRDLYQNRLSGTLPSQLGRLTDLSSGLCAARALSPLWRMAGGSVSTWRMVWLTALCPGGGRLLYGNRFSGTLPSQMSKLSGLSGGYCVLTNGQCKACGLAHGTGLAEHQIGAHDQRSNDTCAD